MQLKLYESHAWLLNCGYLKGTSIIKINLFCFHLRHSINFFVCFVDLLVKAYDVPTLIRKLVNHLQMPFWTQSPRPVQRNLAQLAAFLRKPAGIGTKELGQFLSNYSAMPAA